MSSFAQYAIPFRVMAEPAYHTRTYILTGTRTTITGVVPPEPRTDHDDESSIAEIHRGGETGDWRGGHL